ncbi:MAG: hypothetical protein R3E79_01015 [Caldilineaceae bacterium]
MVVTIDAIFDGKAFQPVQPVRLPPNTRVQIAITAEDEVVAPSFLDVAESLALDGPPDWSAQLDEYLYGGKPTDGS